MYRVRKIWYRFFKIVFLCLIPLYVYIQYKQNVLLFRKKSYNTDRLNELDVFNSLKYHMIRTNTVSKNVYRGIGSHSFKIKKVMV